MAKPPGFVLAEVVIVLLLSSIVVAALLAGLVAVVRGLQPQAVVINGQTLPTAPSFGAFSSAVRLNQSFADAVGSARAVYVFGGRHLSIPASAAPRTLHPLRTMSLPVISDFSPGLPMNAQAFYDAYAAELGEQETGGTSDDFSIVIIGAVNRSTAVTCLVQVRRTDVAIADGGSTTAYVQRDVKLWDPTDPAPQRYAYAERAAQVGTTFIGAVHTWLRYQATPAASEEGPVCVVFPDPWVYAGARGQSDDLPAFSRFTYFLPVSR